MSPRKKTSAPAVSLHLEQTSFDLLFRNHPIPMWLYDLETLAFLDVNEAAVEKYGYSREEFLSLTIKDIRPAEDVPRLLEDVGKNRPPWQHSGEWRHRLKSGEVIHVEITSHTLKWDGRKCALVTAQDVTAQKRVEHALRTSEAKYRFLVENLPAVLYLDKPDEIGTSHYFSPQVEAMLGHPPSAYERDPHLWRSQVHPQDYERELKTIQRTLTDGKSTEEYRMIAADGRVVWVRDTSVLLRDSEGNPQFIQGFIENITERKLAEEELRKSEERYRHIAEDTPAMVCRFQPDGTLTFMNSFYCDYFGKTKEELLGSNLFALIPGPEKETVKRYMNSLTLEKPFVTYEYKTVNIGSGNECWQRWTDRVLFNERGEVVEYQSVGEDITERRQAEERLRRSEEILRLFIEHSPAAIAMLDRSMKYIAVSNRYLTDYRLGEQDIIGKSHYEVFPEIPERWKKIHQKCLAGAVEKADEDFFPRMDGSVDWVKWEIRPWHEEDGQIGGIMLFSEIVTQQKLARDAQKESEERYRGLFDNSPISLWEEDFSAVKIKLDELKQAGVKDFEAYFSERPETVQEFASLVRILNVNEASVKLFGAKDKAELAKSLGSLLRTDDMTAQFRAELVNIANGLTYFEREDEDRRLDGGTLHTSVTWTAMPGHEEDLARVIVSIVDVTERKQMENERRQLISELGERVKELTVLHEITRIFMDYTRDEDDVMQEMADSMPAAWQYPEITAARVGYNGKQFTSPNYRETEWMQSQFFDLPNGDLGFVQIAYLEERPEADEGPFLKEERRLIILIAEKMQTYLRGKLAERAINRQIAELETLYESGLAINRLLTPQEIARAMIEILRRRMDWHHIAIRQYDPETESVNVIGFNKPGISVEEAEVYKAKLGNIISNPAQGLSGWVIQNEKPALVPDVHADERYMPVFPDIRSGVYVPLKAGSLVIGSIAVESEVENAFTVEDQRLLETLAGQAAVAIQNAKLFSELQAELIERRLIEEQIRQLNAELEQRVEERTAQIETVRRRLELAAHAGQIGVWEYIPAENRVIWDERMHIIHHLEIGSFDGTPQAWAELIHPDDLPNPAALFEWMFAASERRILLPNGSARHLAVNAVTVFGEDNKPERIIGICMDVTRNKEAEETLRLANVEMETALRVKDEFLANMSHELRTPLNAILGMSESLEEQIVGGLNEKQLKYVQTIRESGRHLLELINDILDISKIEAGRMELEVRAVSVEKLCRASLGMVRELAQKKSLDISFEIKGNVRVIAGDERRLKQTLVNLLSNAIKFTESGRRIGLEVEGRPQQNEVTFTVWDEGIGIAQENMQRLFKPFVQLDSGLTREYQGTGLGLALVAQIARLHGGRVSVQSEVGRGSRFTVTLPWPPDAQNARAKVTGELRLPQDKPVTKRSGNILLIEDTESIVALMEQYLSHLGYDVLVARNGVKGIIVAKQKRPDLILMDVMMPVMDGLEAARILRADKEMANVPIIAMTALAMPGDRERCLAAGMNDYLSKPIRMDELAEVIERHLERQRKDKPK